MSGDELTELEQAIQADLDEVTSDLSGQTEPAPDKPAKKPKGGKKAKKQEEEALQGTALDRWYARYQPVIGNAFQPEGYTDLIKTSMPKFNAIMGVGGLPRGCITTVWGKEGGGKTAFWQTIVGDVQRQYPNMIIVIIDGEAKFDAPTAERNGMNCSAELIESHKLIYLNPSIQSGLTFEGSIGMLETLLGKDTKTGEWVAPDGVFAIIDSLDSMMTVSDIALEADDGGGKFGAMAKANSVVLRRLTGDLKLRNSNLIIVQQVRDIQGGGMGGAVAHGTSGGHAPKHHSKVRIKLTPTTAIKVESTGEVLAHNVEMLLTKNNYFRPFVQASTALYYNFEYGPDDNLIIPGGWDRAGDLIDLAAENDLIKVTGGWVDLEPVGGVKCNGREKTRRWLYEHPFVLGELDRVVREVLFGD